MFQSQSDPKKLELLDGVIDHQNSKIKDAAISVRIEIIYKNNPDQAFLELIERGATIPPLIENSIDDLTLIIDEKLLIKALDEADPSVRYFTARYLLKNKSLSKEICHKLLNDKVARVKKVGLLGLIELGETVDIDMIRKLFLETKPTLLGTLLDNQVRVNDLIQLILEKRDPNELLSSLNFYKVDSEDAYRLLAIKHFNLVEPRIRSDLEQGFESFRIESIAKIKEGFGEEIVETILNKIRTDTIESSRAEFIAAALEGLAENGIPGDIKYARKYLGNISRANDGAIKLLSKFGDSSDVEKLLTVGKETYGETKKNAVLTALNLSANKEESLAQLLQSKDSTITKIAAQNLSYLDSYRKIELAKNILASENDEFRIIGVAILGKYSSKENLDKFLEEYLSKDSYYYNVVTWLDRFLFAPGRYGSFFQNQLINKIETASN